MNASLTIPSRLIGPEDLVPGDYVTVAHVTYEYVDRDCGGGAQVGRIEMLADGAGCPLRVVVVCRPYVLVEHPEGKHYPLDLRTHRLALLSEGYAKQAFKLMGRKQK